MRRAVADLGALLTIVDELGGVPGVVDVGMRVPGRVEATVVDDAEGSLQRRYDERYGRGPVRIHSQLQPFDL